jgi:hypothetical protein
MKKRNVEGMLDELGAEILCFQGELPQRTSRWVQDLTGRAQDPPTDARKVHGLSRAL